MGYWKIVAGHKEQTPDDVRSVMLGDWLRNEYVAIGWDEGDNPQHRVFKNDVTFGDKIVVVAEGFIWAIGEITGDFETVDLPEGSNLYKHRRKVVWFRVMKISYKQLPDSVRNILQDQHTINSLNPTQWESIVIYTS